MPHPAKKRIGEPATGASPDDAIAETDIPRVRRSKFERFMIDPFASFHVVLRHKQGFQINGLPVLNDKRKVQNRSTRTEYLKAFPTWRPEPAYDCR